LGIFNRNFNGVRLKSGKKGGASFFYFIFLLLFLRYNTYFIHEYKWDVVLQINGKVKFFLATHLSDIFFFPTPIRDLKAKILEVHNGFIHHEKKVACVFWYFVKVMRSFLLT